MVGAGDGIGLAVGCGHTGSACSDGLQVIEGWMGEEMMFRVCNNYGCLGC